MRVLLTMAEADHAARWAAVTVEEREVFFERLRAFSAAVGERGTVVAGEGLAGPDQALTLRDGTLTTGPYAETAEQVGGFYLLDLPSMDDAVELVRLLPEHYTYELRPCVSE